MKDFIQASEEQIFQHLEYLNKAGHAYISPKINIVTSIPATSHYVQPAKAVKPADADFYCVTLKQGRGCTKYHQTYEDAEKEATRLSKQEQKKAYILGVVGEVEVVPTTTYETKINKY